MLVIPVHTIWQEVLVRFLIWQFGKLGKDRQNLKLTINACVSMALSILIAKFKFHQYELRAVLPNLMLTKVTHYTVYMCMWTIVFNLSISTTKLYMYVHVHVMYKSSMDTFALHLVLVRHVMCKNWA